MPLENSERDPAVSESCAKGQVGPAQWFADYVE